MTSPAFDRPGSSAPGDVAFEGTGTATARHDHRHGREAADANLSTAAGSVAQIDVGDTASAGASTLGARVDHQHALPAPAAPTTSAVGDAAATGSATTVARADHTHGREAFAVSAQDAVDVGSAGAATTVSRGDHVHAVPMLYNPPRCRVYFSAGTQTLTTTVAAAVTFDAETTDSTGMHSTSSNTSRVTIAVAGRYRCVGTVAFAANATGFRGAYLKRTGTTIAETRMGSSQATVRHGQQVVEDILCGVGDYIELWAEQGSGGNLNLAAGESVTFLDVVWVGTT